MENLSNINTSRLSSRYLLVKISFLYSLVLACLTVSSYSSPLKSNSFGTYQFHSLQHDFPSQLELVSFENKSRSPEIPEYQITVYQKPATLWDKSKYLMKNENKDNEATLFDSPTFVNYIQKANVQDFKDIRVTNLERHINIYKNSITVKYVIKFKTTHAESESSGQNKNLILMFPVHEAVQMTSISAVYSDEKSTPLKVSTIHGLSIEDYSSFQEDELPSMHGVNISHLNTNQADQSITLTYILGRPFLPVPASKLQTDVQILQWKSSTHVLSPYFVENQITYVTFSRISQEIKEETDHSKKGHGDTWVVGPFKNSLPFNIGDPLSFSFEQKAPLPYFPSSSKVVNVSPWGNVNFEESFHVINEAATLKGHFSRLDTTSKSLIYRSMVLGLTDSEFLVVVQGIFDPKISTLQFYDVNGNISTSRVKDNYLPSFYLSNFVPRYPLLGGWRSEFNISYNAPLGNFLFKDKNNTHYLLISPYTSMLDVYSEKHTLKVILPYGSKNVRYSSDFVPLSEKISTHWGWFQTVGPSVSLELEFKGFFGSHSEILSKSFFIIYETQSFIPTLSILITFLLIFLIPLCLFLLSTYSPPRISDDISAKNQSRSEAIEHFKKAYFSFMEDLVLSFDTLVFNLKEDNANKNTYLQNWMDETEKNAAKIYSLYDNFKSLPQDIVTLKTTTQNLIDTLYKLSTYESIQDSQGGSNKKNQGKSNTEKLSLEDKFSQLDKKISSILLSENFKLD